MEITELCLGPARSCKDVDRREPILDGRHSIPKEDSVLDGHRPELSVCGFWPVDGGVDHHRSSNSHDGLDRSLGDPIVMMGTDS
jgi:hypothetical protein